MPPSPSVGGSASFNISRRPPLVQRFLFVARVSVQSLPSRRTGPRGRPLSIASWWNACGVGTCRIVGSAQLVLSHSPRDRSLFRPPAAAKDSWPAIRSCCCYYYYYCCCHRHYRRCCRCWEMAFESVWLPPFRRRCRLLVAFIPLVGMPPIESCRWPGIFLRIDDLASTTSRWNKSESRFRINVRVHAGSRADLGWEGSSFLDGNEVGFRLGEGELCKRIVNCSELFNGYHYIYL